MFFYVVPKVSGHNIILGLPGLKHQRVDIAIDGPQPIYGDFRIVVRNEYRTSEHPRAISPIFATRLSMWNHRRRTNNKAEVFVASLIDIEKALRPKRYSDLRKKLPRHYSNYLLAFNR